MQAEQRHSRRRRRVEGFPQLLLPVVVAGVCLSAALMGGVNAFVQPSIIAAAPGRREVLRHGLGPTVGYSAVRKALQLTPKMVLGESTPAECRRALQRAWQASSTESVAHEQVRACLPLAVLDSLPIPISPACASEWNWNWNGFAMFVVGSPCLPSSLYGLLPRATWSIPW